MSGLRERKKQATREALSFAALRMAVERGIENVLVEDIAAAVDVSPRTFNNYFSSKYEAIVWRELNRAVKIGDLLRARPRDEPLWDSVEFAVLEVYGGDADPDYPLPRDRWTEGVRRIVSHPQTLAEILKGRAQVVRVLAEAIAERLGPDVEHELFPMVFAGAVMAACAAAQEYWLTAGPPMSMGEALRQALRQLIRIHGGKS